MSFHIPTVNAFFNGLACVLLIIGFVLIKRDSRKAHARTMVAAFGASSAFFAGYLYYHFKVVPEIGHTPYNGTGGLKLFYYGLLISHVLLAAVNLPMILRTLWLAHRGDFERHRAWARWTFPVWLYVSVTGVVVYLFLYPWNPEVAA